MVNVHRPRVHGRVPVSWQSRNTRRGAAHPACRSRSRRSASTAAALGAPAASQITLEVGVFALATALAAQLDAVSSASHQIALNIVSLVFMVPLGLASAARCVSVTRSADADSRGHATRDGRAWVSAPRS
jgi:hypothetical protein